MCTRKHLLNIKGISEAKVDKIKDGAAKLLDVIFYKYKCIENII